MATKVVMEALSPTMEEGRLVKWMKNEGDAVKSGDVLAEVETDKAVMELVARADGVLRKRIANEGDASPVGTLLAVIAGPDENIDSIVASAPAAAAAKPAGGAEPAQPTAGAVPQAPTQSQGEASTPPQEKQAVAAQPTAPPPVAFTGRAPGDSPRPQRAGGNGPRPGAPPPPQAQGGRQRSSPLARRRRGRFQGHSPHADTEDNRQASRRIERPGSYLLSDRRVGCHPRLGAAR